MLVQESLPCAKDPRPCDIFIAALTLPAVQPLQLLSFLLPCPCYVLQCQADTQIFVPGDTNLWHPQVPGSSDMSRVFVTLPCHVNYAWIKDLRENDDNKQFANFPQIFIFIAKILPWQWLSYSSNWMYIHISEQL